MTGIPSRVKNCAGVEFGKLTVLSYAGRSKYGQAAWLCRCQCGRETVVQGGDLRSGNTSSCGCVKRSVLGNSRRTHGKSRTRTYSIWCNMLDRCRRAGAKDWGKYGGRGITVCSRWHQYRHFLADMGECPAGMTIERIENDKGYYQENCKWATRQQQTNNRSTTVFYEHNGLRLAATDWDVRLGLKKGTTYRRVYVLGWPLSRALVAVS